MKTIKKLYQEARKAGYTAEYGLAVAKAVLAWEDGEGEKWKIEAEDEQENYFDVFGVPDDEKERKAIEHSIETYGNYCVVSYYWDKERNDWAMADSIGHCAGYKDVLDWKENWYVPDLMRSAMDKFNEQDVIPTWKAAGVA